MACWTCITHLSNLFAQYITIAFLAPTEQFELIKLQDAEYDVTEGVSLTLFNLSDERLLHIGSLVNVAGTTNLCKNMPQSTLIHADNPRARHGQGSELPTTSRMFSPPQTQLRLPQLSHHEA